MLWRSLILIPVVLLGACGADGELVVDIRTDLIPGEEFDVIVAEVEGFPSLRRSVSAVSALELRRGFRLGGFDGVPPSSIDLRVTLQRESGVEVMERRVLVDGRGTRVVTVVFSQLCRDVVCPRAGDASSATQCVEGECVEPQCTPETPEGCEGIGCTTQADCVAAGLADCASFECSGGTCVINGDDAMCPTEQYCDGVQGCTPRCDSECAVPGDPCALGRVDCVDTPECIADGVRPNGTMCRETATCLDGVCGGDEVCTDEADCVSCLGGDCLCLGTTCVDVVDVQVTTSGTMTSVFVCSFGGEIEAICEVGPDDQCTLRCRQGSQVQVDCQARGDARVILFDDGVQCSPSECSNMATCNETIDGAMTFECVNATLRCDPS